MGDYLTDRGYKKEGNVYTPPFLQLGQFTPTLWLEDVLPEIIWIGLLQEKLGFDLGTKLALELSDVTKNICKNEELGDYFAPLSHYSLLNNDEKKKVKDILEITRILEYYVKAFEPISILYPEFPLSFLIEKNNIKGTGAVLEEFKEYLAKLYYKTESAPMLMKVAAIHILLLSGHLKIKTGLINFELFNNFQYYDESLQSFAQKTISFYLSKNSTIYVRNDSWCNYFWNRGLELDKCY